MVKNKVFVSVIAVFASLVHGVSDADRVSVMEGDLVTLHTNITINPQDRIHWFFNDTSIARINGDLSNICTDVQCNEENERFRCRLKLDNRTGDLTIINITNTDDGVYVLSMNSRTYLNVSVHGVSAAERDEMRRKSVKEGESVTLNPGEIKTNGVMKWYFNGTLIAEITGDQRKICTYVQCKERFRGRLNVNETGSLTIMNITDTDSGEYKLQINNSRITSVKIFSVAVTGSAPSAVLTGIAVAVLLVFAAAGVGVIYCRRRSSKKRTRERDLRGSQHIGDNLPQPFSLEKPLMGKESELEFLSCKTIMKV